MTDQNFSQPPAIQLEVPVTQPMRPIKPGNSFADRHPELVDEWDMTKNTLSPHEVSFGNSLKVWWKCRTCQHEWSASIINRRQGRGCAACSGRFIIPGQNDLFTTKPAYQAWWADEETDPTSLSAGSGKKVRWKCPTADHLFIRSVKTFNLTCPICVQNPLSVRAPHLMSEWSSENLLNPDEVSYNSAQKAQWVCNTCSHQWETFIYQRVNSNTGCPRCALLRSASTGEDELDEWFVSLGFIVGDSYRRRDRTLLQGREVDFYFPDQNVAVEYNGLYWHSEAGGKDRHYHQSKWASCRQAGVQLIQVWEDDWNRNPEQVKAMLAHKLKLNQGRRIGARKTKIQPVNHHEAALFLKQHHVQGFVTGSSYLALVDSGEEIVALAVFTLRGTSVQLDRYATSCMVQGGLGKLLHHVPSLYPSATEVVTFAAHDVSDGNLYQTLGFQAEKELPADYSYLVRGERVHKFNYRLKRFREDPNLVWEEGLSESQLAALNNLARIWDAGKTRFRLELPDSVPESS